MNGAMLLNDASIIFSAAYTYCHYETLEYQKKNRYSQTSLYTQVLSVVWQKKSISANIAFSSLDGFLDCHYVLQSQDPTLGIGHLLSLLFLDILVFRHPVIYLSVALSTAFFISFLSCYLSGNLSSYQFSYQVICHFFVRLSGFYSFSVFLDGYK